MLPTLHIRCLVAVVTVVTLCSPLRGQSILDSELVVQEKLRSLDSRLRDQLQVWFDGRDAALTAEGKQTAEWWKVAERLNPITVHGNSILEFAKTHSGSRDALICLAYIVEWGEGNPRALYRSACDELVLHHRDDGVLSYICSSCTNPWSFDENKAFLIRLRNESRNPTVQAAAEFYLAQLFDNFVVMLGQVSEIRDQFETAGALEAKPELRIRLIELEKMAPNDLERDRDKLLAGILGRQGDAKPWTAKRTFGRLDYEFLETSDAQSFRQRAEDLRYQITHLRVGCIAPDFVGKLSDGNKFQIIDRRGTPTLLMFSFKGCGACEAMYPALRAVQERFSQDGFSVVGVMVDQGLEPVTTAIESGTISWPCVWDGPSGPIAKAYRVASYPTVLLLDADGRIVARNLRQEEHLIKHIDGLISDADAKARRTKR